MRNGWDGAIAELAQRQHGVVARTQLVDLGFGRGAIDHWLTRGRLHRIHRGVYAVGHRVMSREGRFMAAPLASGDHAVLSHGSAAALWGLRPATRALVDVTVARNLHPRPGISVHRVLLPADEVTVERGIPVTSAARTLFDLATVVTPRALERAVQEAGWVEADCVWRRPRVVVELDGYASHGTRAAFERDRALQAAGWRVVRITWRQLEEERDVVGAELRELLGRRVRPFRPRRGERAISVRPGARPRP